MMKKVMFLQVLVLLSALLCSAEDNSKNVEERLYELGSIIVTATKTEAYQSELGSFTTVITAEEIKKMGKITVVELLRTVPGITVTQNGGTGSFAVLRLRGGEPGYTMVMIDGIEVRYPMEHSGGFFDFAHLTTDNIERIEIVRGPQSTLYGSSAMSGVINIITKKGGGRRTADVSLEAGSNSTYRTLLGLSGGEERLNYSFSASHTKSDGTSAAAEGAESDGYKINSISAGFGVDMPAESRLSLFLRYTDADIDLDDGPYEDDPNYTSGKEMLNSKIQFEQMINDRWEHMVSYSLLNSERTYNDLSDSTDTAEDMDSKYEGDIKMLSWQHNFCTYDYNTLTCGLDYKKEDGSSYYSSGGWIEEVTEKSVDNMGYYLQNQVILQDKISVTAGIRIDDHEFFGTETTCKLSLSCRIPGTGTRPKANWGTGFRAPSLYQLYSIYGDPDLEPEESESYDIGFEQGFMEGKMLFSAAYFHNDFKNLIDYSFTSSKYENIGKAETKGVETEIAVKLRNGLTMRANYTHLDALDKETGEELLRRPGHQASLNLNWIFLEKGSLNLGIIHTGKSKDYTPYPTIGENSAYTKVDVSASYDLNDTYQVFGRIENLLDEDYQEVYGYGMPGRSVYTGIRAGF